MTSEQDKRAEARPKPSYELVPYHLRPAKCIERKMLRETFQRLAVFEPLDRYRYVGFGSTYFTDFSLFHKTLGIADMISIEKDKYNQKRFEFNKPYCCIAIEFKKSTVVLPTLDWDKRTILWLDYDGKLDRGKLSDVKCSCTNMISGSVLVVSVNVRPDWKLRERLSRLQRAVGEEKLPIGTALRDFKGDWGVAHVVRQILTNEISETLSAKNGVLSPDSKLHYRQLFNFQYKDGVEMLTVGGILYSTEEGVRLDKCAFEDLDFVRESADPYRIEVPNLTYRELRYLDAQLPSDYSKLDNEPGIPDEDLEKYSHIYRYFPTFTEAEL